MAFLLFACEDGHNRQGLVRNLRSLRNSAQEAAGVSRSEIKEEARAQRQPGDIRGGSRPLALGSGTNANASARRETTWAS
jgi:hypothetical protein